MKKVLFFLFCFNQLLAQSKKEQIESLYFKIDSIQQTFQLEKQHLSEEIKDLKNSEEQRINEINNLKVVLKKTQDEKKSLEKDVRGQHYLDSVCVDFFNYHDITSSVKLFELVDCAPPSYIKAEFYKHVYEALAVEHFFSEHENCNLSLLLVNKLFSKIENNTDPLALGQSDLIFQVKMLDQLVDDLEKNTSGALERLISGLSNFYYNNVVRTDLDEMFWFPEIYVYQVGDYVVYSGYHPGGNEAHGGIYEIGELYDVSNGIFELSDELNMRLTKLIGKDFFLGYTGCLEFNFDGQYYEAVVCVYRSNDSMASPSGAIKLVLSKDLIVKESFFGSISANEPNQVKKWQRF